MKALISTFVVVLFAASAFQAKAQSAENTRTHITYTTIQSAIDNADSGDVILVGAGTYNEQLTVDKPGITLEGDGSYPLITYSGSPVIKPAANNLTIEGFEIASTIKYTGGYTENALIWDGAWSATVSGLTVIDCKLHDSDIGIRGSGLYGNVTVKNCEFYRLKEDGVFLSSDNFASTIGMTIDIHDNYFHDFVYDTSYANNCKDGAAVAINNSNAWINGNVYDNYISGMKIGLRDYYAGPANAQLVFSRNTIDMTDQSIDSPVPYGTMGFAFWGVGPNAGNIVIKNNIIANCGWYAIYQDGSSTVQGSVTVENNLFYNNYKYYWPNYQLTYQWSGNDAAAQAGWTGSANEFTFTNNVSAKSPLFKYTGTDTTRWALQNDSPALSAGSDGGNIGAWQHILKAFVDDSAAAGWYNQTHVSTIREGINLIESGGTVDLAPRTYDDSLNINKPLTLTSDDSTNMPTIQLPDADAAGIVIEADSVTLKNLYLNKVYQGGSVNSILSVPRGGSYPNYTIGYQNITLQNLVFNGGQEGAYITAKDLTVENCEFNNQYDDALYLDAVAGTTNILSNTFSGGERKKAILFENFTGYDPPESGTININDNTLNGKMNFVVYDQWIGLTTKIDLDITNNKIDSVGQDAISFFIYGAPSGFAAKFDSVNINGNDFAGVAGGNYGISLSSLDASYNDLRVNNLSPANGGISIDARTNWWGNATGPGGAADGTGAGITTNVRFNPFLNVGTDESTAPGFQGDFSALGISISGTGADTTGSLQDAIDLSNAGGTVDVDSGSYDEGLDINKNLTVNLSNGNASFSGNLTIGPGGTLDAHGHNITVAGSWDNSGTFIPGNGTVTFDASSGSQSINNPETFHNLTVNKSAGSLKLLSNITVNDTVSITNGTFDLNGDTLSLGSSGFLSERAGNPLAGGIIRITKALDGPDSLDVGGLGAEISSSSNLGNTTVMRGSAVQTGNGFVSIKRYYIITPTGDSGLNATLVFHYDTSELNGLNGASLQLYRSTDGGATWTPMGGTVNTTAGTVTLAGINSFSTWTLGSSDHSLPVQATSFAAEAAYGSVTLTWKTPSEVNNAGFNILREDSGSTAFKLIASYETDNSLKGLGTSTSGKDYSFTDTKVMSGCTYQYKIRSVSTSGAVNDLVTLTVTLNIPKTYALFQNYPNPFNPATTIKYQLPTASQVTLTVYDVLGREVTSLVNDYENAGVHEAVFDGGKYASGMYFYRLTAHGNDGQEFASIKKFILMK